MKRSVLFVCLGNICRSPIAEAVFIDLVKKRNVLHEWDIDSAAIIDYHIGKGPDSRTMSTLREHNITDYNHRVRQVTSADFDTFDYVFGMDDDNISDLNSLNKTKSKKQGKKACVELLGKYDPKGERIIPDPYYSENKDAFELVFQQCLRCCDGFLKSLTT